MHDNETQQMILTIIEHAKTTKPTEFRFLRNWTDYRFYKGKLRSFKLLIKALNSGCDRLFKNYCSSVVSGEGDLNKLLAYQQMLEVIDFYQRELFTITDMLCEYDTYLMEGHLFWAFLGESRSDADMRDFRE
jgi:hypothetical protein